MQKFLLVATLFIAFSSHAKTPQELCSLISSYSSSSGSDCIQAIASAQIFDSGAVDVCYSIAQSSVSSGVTCIKLVAGHLFEQDAIDVCNLISQSSSSSAITCISTVSDKIFLNGTAGLCKQIAQSSSSSGVTCLANAGKPAVPAQPLCPSLKDIQSSINASLNAIYSGSPRTAVGVLQDLQNKISPCVR